MIVVEPLAFMEVLASNLKTVKILFANAIRDIEVPDAKHLCRLHQRLAALVLLVPMEEPVTIYQEDIAVVAVQDLLEQLVNVAWVPVNQVLVKMEVFVPKLLVLHMVSVALVQPDLQEIAVKLM